MYGIWNLSRKKLILTSPAPQKKVTNTQTSFQQKPKNCLSVFYNSLGLALKGFIANFSKLKPSNIYLIKNVQMNFQNKLFD